MDADDFGIRFTCEGVHRDLTTAMKADGGEPWTVREDECVEDDIKSNKRHREGHGGGGGETNILFYFHF